ncbi:MAG: hypothetical protein PHS14_00855 [Elusimicrobia bacterium]|nr:hypothetical protein [Elusimicrobiota bacterium]
MKTKKKGHGPSAFTRGRTASTKSTRRHARRPAVKSRPKEEFVGKLEELIPL